MQTINVSIHVKESADMSPAEFNAVLNKLDQGKAGLMQWLWLMLEGSPKRQEIYNNANLYITSDEIAEMFLEKFFDGDMNPDAIEQSFERFFAWLYSEEE
jgi:hypothetical protein